jgi:hypothetical protein
VEEKGGSQRKEGLVGVVCSPPSLGPPLYRGRGAPLPLNQGSQGRWPRGGVGRWLGGVGWGQDGPSKTLTLVG